MKPTSIIFLILSAILIVSGIIVCVIAGAIAKSDDIELYVDYIDEDGNAVVEYDLSGKKTSDINIELKEAEISIVGNAEKSYVKIENCPTKTYDYLLADGEISIKDAGILSFFSSFRINESGFGFTGLRHYLALGRYKDMPHRVTVYLAKGAILHSVNVSIGKGSVSLSSAEVREDCTVTVTEGGVTFDNVTCPGNVKAVCDTGDIVFKRCMLASTNAEVTRIGDVECEIDMQYSFALKSVLGGVYLDSVNNGSDFSGLYPADELERKVAESTEPVTDDADKDGDTTASDDEDDKKDDASSETAETTGDANGGETEPETVIEQRLLVGRVNQGNIRITVIRE